MGISNGGSSPQQDPMPTQEACLLMASLPGRDGLRYGVIRWQQISGDLPRQELSTSIRATAMKSVPDGDHAGPDGNSGLRDITAKYREDHRPWAY